MVIARQLKHKTANNVNAESDATGKRYDFIPAVKGGNGMLYVKELHKAYESGKNKYHKMTIAAQTPALARFVPLLS